MGKSAKHDPPAATRSCVGCRYFIDDPEMLERSFPGILILSSPNGSTRGEAGICQLTQTFRDPRFFCEQYEPFPDAADGEMDDVTGG